MYADLVEQKTSTTGTGGYVVSGAVVGRRSFADAFAHGENEIPYVVTDDAGAFECGMGTWDEGTLTLARTTVWASSNAGAAVNWAAGEKRIFVSPFAAMMGLNTRKHAIGLSLPPNGTDAYNAGFRPGSMYLYNQRLFVFQDSATGFNEFLYSTGVKGKVDVPGYLTNKDLNWSGQFLRGHTFGQGKVTGGAVDAYAEGGAGSLGAITTDATATKLGGVAGTWTGNGGIGMSDSTSGVLRGSLVARDAATGDTKAWAVEAVLKADGAGNVTVAAGGTPTEVHEDAATTAWAVTVLGGSYDVTLQVTGEAAKTIGWSFVGTIAVVTTY